MKISLSRWVGLAAVVVAALAGCGADPPDPAPAAQQSPAASPPPDPSTSSPAATLGAATPVDAYRGMWAAYLAALATADPAHPDLARYATGDALRLLVNGLTTVQSGGLVGHGDVALNPQVVAVSPGDTPPSVQIEDCVDTSQTHLVRVDGAPYQDTPGGWRLARAKAVEQPDATWRVSQFALFAVGSC